MLNLFFRHIGFIYHNMYGLQSSCHLMVMCDWQPPSNIFQGRCWGKKGVERSTMADSDVEEVPLTTIMRQPVPRLMEVTISGFQ